MPVVVNEGDVLQLNVYCSLDDQTSVNVLHYLCEFVETTPQPILSFASDLDTSISVAYKSILSSAASYRGVGVRKVVPLPKSAEFFATTGQGAGTRTGDPLPRQVCGVITKGTDFAGQAQRGRFYAAFPAESDSGTDGSPVSTYVSNLAALGAFLDDLLTVGIAPTTSTATPVIFHRLIGDTTPITRIVARPRWGTQRSRGDYGRPNVSPI